MKILYVADLSRGSTGRHRMLALERLGHELGKFDLGAYKRAGRYPFPQLRHRTLWGPVVKRFNRDLIDAACLMRPDLIWLDKANFAWPETIWSLRVKTDAKVVAYIVDNPWAGRDWGWRHYLNSVGIYDAHVISHESRHEPLVLAGASNLDIIYLPYSYEPTVHFPLPETLDLDQQFDVSFIGYPWDDRPEFIISLIKDYGIKVNVWGHKWRKILNEAGLTSAWRGTELHDTDYSSVVWKSKVMLGFVTKSNYDEYSRRTFEITAMGGCLVTPQTSLQETYFNDTEHLMFYRSLPECAAIISRLLESQIEREDIGKRAAYHASTRRYDNDAVLEKCLRNFG